MRVRWLVTQWGLFFGTGVALAQAPACPQPPARPQPPLFPQSPPQTSGTPTSLPQAPAPIPPRMFPGQKLPTPKSPPAGKANRPDAKGPGGLLAMPQDLPLPQRENKIAINAQDISLKRVAGGAWQLWMGQKILRDFGVGDVAEINARDAARVFRDVRPTEWATIGSPHPVVEYGLINGRAPMAPGLSGAGSGADDRGSGLVVAGGVRNGPLVSGAGARAIIPIDLRTVRVEAIRGVWCLRDDTNLLFNFGANRADADQARAVILRYGFNRVGVVGSPTPVMNYLFASTDPAPQPNAGLLAQVALQAQIDGLQRIGIPVAGVGYVGEMFRFEPRKLEVVKNGGEWQVVAGSELIGRFGPSEFAARDALRAIQDSRFNEFCKVGSLNFFLVNGKAPTRVPYHVQGRRFDPNALRVSKQGETCAVTENGRMLFHCANAEEGETLIRVIKHFQFDQLCHLGPSAKVGVSFLAKGR